MSKSNFHPLSKYNWPKKSNLLSLANGISRHEGKGGLRSFSKFRSANEPARHEIYHPMLFKICTEDDCHIALLVRGLLTSPKVGRISNDIRLHFGIDYFLGRVNLRNASQVEDFFLLYNYGRGRTDREPIYRKRVITDDVAAFPQGKAFRRFAEKTLNRWFIWYSAIQRDSFDVSAAKSANSIP